MNASQIADIRRRLVEGKIALRDATDDVALAKTQAEQCAIDAAGGEKALGANAEARQRALALALTSAHDYTTALAVQRGLQAVVDRLEAELETAQDARREWEWTIRARLADALAAQHIPSEPDDGAFDGAIDDAAAREATSMVAARIEGEPEEEIPF